jgi:hypothetical protein
LRAVWTTLMPTASAAAARMARVMFVVSPRLSNGLWQPQVRYIARSPALWCLARSFAGSASVESVTADSERGGQPAEDPRLVQGPEREAVRRVWALLAAARVAGDNSQVVC